VRRLGLIGDVHAEDERLAVALARLADEGAETVVCMGDIVDGPGDVDRCVEMLAAHAVVTVRGNHERWLLADELRDMPGSHQRGDLAAATLDFLAGLPATRSLETVAGPVLVCHGLGDDDMAGVQPWDTEMDLVLNIGLCRLSRVEAPRIVVNGHTHRRLVRAVDGGRVIVNAGTIFRKHEPCFALLDLEASVCRYFTIDAALSVAPAETVPLPSRS
jgi:predicted phosphodiesterase